MTAIATFAALVARHLGLVLDHRHDLLAEVLHRRAARMGMGMFLRRLERGDPKLLRLLAQDLTVTESSFFRDAGQMRAFADLALPARMHARGAARRLRLLSAGCAAGEELHSLAILLRQTPALAGWDIQLQGLDANPAMLKKARAGRYSAWALRQTPPDVSARWFRGHGHDFLLDPAIRAMAEFTEHNLAAEDGFWQPPRFDIVFCRNVLMYFSPAAARAAVGRVARSLLPGGFLFLGHAESLRGLSDAFALCHSHDAFYYQRRPAAARAAAPPPAVAAPRVTPRQAPPPPQAKLDMAEAVALLASDRPAQLQARLAALPPALSQSAEALLLRAVLAAQAGDGSGARAVCSHLIARNEKGAGAHYLTALACESSGDAGAAVRHDRAATVLDPGFAMARLHLGLLARRAGRRHEAARELRQAAALLAREEPARLVLFGGGFSREGLLDLCRAELESL